MALKTFVKVSGVNNLSDARYCAGMGVDLIGFNLDEEHPNFTSIEKFKEISEWLSGVDYVGEFQDSDIQNIIKNLNGYNLTIMQCNDYQALSEANDYQTILEVGIDNLNALPFNLDIDFLLVKSDTDLTNDQISEIAKRVTRVKVLLDCPLSPENVESLLQKTGAYGIALNAGYEIRPGYKDYDELADILEALEIED